MVDNKFNPAYDNAIYQKYSKKTIENKIKNKEAFLREVGLPFSKKVPLVCITYALTDENGLHQVQDIMNGILEQSVEIVIAGIGTAKYQKFFTELAEKNRSKIAIVENSDTEKQKMYAAADIMIIASESKECLEEARRGMKYGVLPLIPPQNFIRDYNPNEEQGNGFNYIKGSPWSLFATFARALENFRFPYDWKNIQISAMELE